MKAKKGKVKKNHGGEACSHGKRDMRKVKCFSCHQYENYARKCPNKNKKGGNETQV